MLHVTRLDFVSSACQNFSHTRSVSKPSERAMPFLSSHLLGRKTLFAKARLVETKQQWSPSGRQKLFSRPMLCPAVRLSHSLSAIRLKDFFNSVALYRIRSLFVFFVHSILHSCAVRSVDLSLITSLLYTPYKQRLFQSSCYHAFLDYHSFSFAHGFGHLSTSWQARTYSSDLWSVPSIRWSGRQWVLYT